jgi:hypothetical protein
MEDKNNLVEHVEMRQDIKGLSVEMRAEFEVVNLTLEKILEQAQKTNGRVTVLETDVDFIRILRKYKWLFALVILGIYQLFNFIDIPKWIGLIF